MKHQVVRAQAGDVTRRVEPSQRIVEVVRQEHRFQPALRQHAVSPVWSGHFCRGRIVQRFPVRRRYAVVGKSEQLAGHFDQPTVLDRVIQRRQALDQSTDFLLRIELGLFDARLGHAGRMSKLGVIVISKQVGQ